MIMIMIIIITTTTTITNITIIIIIIIFTIISTLNTVSSTLYLLNANLSISSKYSVGSKFVLDFDISVIVMRNMLAASLCFVQSCYASCETSVCAIYANLAAMYSNVV